MRARAPSKLAKGIPPASESHGEHMAKKKRPAGQRGRGEDLDEGSTEDLVRDEYPAQTPTSLKTSITRWPSTPSTSQGRRSSAYRGTTEPMSSSRATSGSSTLCDTPWPIPFFLEPLPLPSHIIYRQDRPYV
jgi:hypothetical protein